MRDIRPDGSVFDHKKIGVVISAFGDRKVCHYNHLQVIKQSRILAKFIKWKYLDRAQRDYDLAKKYLGDFVLDSEFVLNETRNNWAIIQPYINGPILTPNHLQDPN